MLSNTLQYKFQKCTILCVFQLYVASMCTSKQAMSQNLNIYTSLCVQIAIYGHTWHNSDWKYWLQVLCIVL